MSNKKYTIWGLVIVLLLYGTMMYFAPAGSNARSFFSPIMYLITYFHELGHALGAIISGGSLHAILIKPNAAGECQVIGGNPAIIIIGGYLGSCLIGNLFLFIGLLQEYVSKLVNFTQI